MLSTVLALCMPCCIVDGSPRRSCESPDPLSIERTRLHREELDSRMPQKLSSYKRQNLSTVSLDRFAEQTCPFFTRLPLELRLLIYEQVLGNHVFHMLSLHGRVGAKICPLADPASIEYDHQRVCFPAKSRILYRSGDQETRGPPEPGDEHKFRVHGTDFYGDIPLQKTIASILRTCRQIYVEAIDTLYKNNVFDFAYAETFRWFRWTVRPEHLALITHLQVGRYIPIQPWWFFWEEMCAVISKMPDLKHLSIYIYDTHGWSGGPSRSITYLFNLRGLQTFNIVARRPPELKGGEYTTLQLPPYTMALKEKALLPREEENKELRRRFIHDMKLMMKTS